MSDVNQSPLPIIIEPALVEAVVLREIAGRPQEHDFRRQRSRLYLMADPEARENSFQEFHLSWFGRLGLAEPIELAVGELVTLAHSCSRCLVTRAPTRADEGADLLVAKRTDGGVERSVLMRLCSSAFGAPTALLALLRRELLHVADMVDPAFGYEPALAVADAGPSYERLLRDRYRVIWEASVAGRLVRRGVAGADAEEAARHTFAAVFPMLGASTGEEFARFFSGAAGTHADFTAFAAAPRGERMTRGLVAGGRCPLCRFPTHAPEPAPLDLAAAIIARIATDFPAWEAADGLCRQCTDLYACRSD